MQSSPLPGRESLDHSWNPLDGDIGVAPMPIRRLWIFYFSWIFTLSHFREAWITPGWRYRSGAQSLTMSLRRLWILYFQHFHFFTFQRGPGSLMDRSQCHSADCEYTTSVECGRPIFSLLHTSRQFLSDCICGFTTPTVSSNPAPNIHYHSFTLTHFRSD